MCHLYCPQALRTRQPIWQRLGIGDYAKSKHFFSCEMFTMLADTETTGELCKQVVGCQASTSGLLYQNPRGSMQGGVESSCPVQTNPPPSYKVPTCLLSLIKSQSHQIWCPKRMTFPLLIMTQGKPASSASFTCFRPLSKVNQYVCQYLLCLLLCTEERKLFSLSN